MKLFKNRKQEKIEISRVGDLLDYVINQLAFHNQEEIIVESANNNRAIKFKKSDLLMLISIDGALSPIDKIGNPNRIFGLVEDYKTAK